MAHDPRHGAAGSDDADEASDLLTLARTEGVGPVRAAALLVRFGGAGDAVEAGLRGEWPALPGWGRPRARAVGRSVDRELAALERRRGERLGARLVTCADADYPSGWQPAEGWPLVLWVRGAWPAAVVAPQPLGLAVVGPRRASPEACRFAGELAAAAAWAGAWVVSGMAYGVDAAAHGAAAAASAGGAPASTIGVLAGGVDRIHPMAHRDLARAMLDAGGGLVAAAAIGAIPAVGAFPVRNRWIAGLSGAVAVVEAGARSGALHTATAALELGREVRTTPARPWDGHAAGSLALLRDGAAPLISPDDGWRALPPGAFGAAMGRRPPAVVAPSPWGALLPTGAHHPDAWAAAAGVPVADALAALEVGLIEGWAIRRPDGRYAATSVAGAPRAGEGASGAAP